MTFTKDEDGEVVVIGSGVTADVKHGTYDAGIPVALKHYKEGAVLNKVLHDLIREVEVLWSLDHPHIVCTYGACTSRSGGKPCCLLVMEFGVSAWCMWCMVCCVLCMFMVSQACSRESGEKIARYKDMCVTGWYVCWG